MLRNRLMAGLAVLALLGTIVGCGGDTGESPEATSTFTLDGYVTVDAYHYDEATGTYVQFYHDEGSNVITTIGKTFIEEHLGIGGASYDDPAKWISLSNDGSSSAAWTKLPVELDNTNGLGRAEGAYASTSPGVWTITYQFTASVAGGTVQTTGLQWLVTLESDNNLMAAKDFTQVTLASGDKLTVTWTITLS
ncbi:hypothetical protein ES703_67296 [subsurface metagenome]